MAFPARYPGVCASCPERIHEGDLIEMSDDGPAHADCDASTPAPTREHPVCTTCWLTHPEGACDR